MITLKILTVNIHKGFGYFNRRFILPELREAVRTTQADLVFLQEVLGEHNIFAAAHERWPDQPQYEFLADTMWPQFAYGRNAVYPAGHHGNAVLSKYPIHSWDNHDVSVGKIEKRGLLHCVLSLERNAPPLHAICAHFSLRESHRQKQLDSLTRLVNNIPMNEPVIVAGDFNDWMQKANRKLANKANLVDVFSATWGKPPRTFPAALPMLRLDRIFVRSAETYLPLVLPNRPWSHLSDHKPLFAEINL